LSNAKESPRFEELVSGVEEVVGRLQSGAVPLHEALALYERGHALLKEAQGQLDAANAKLELLRKDGQAES